MTKIFCDIADLNYLSFFDNDAGTWTAGALRAETSSDISISNCTFSQNHAGDHSSANFNAIVFTNAFGTIENSIVWGNTSKPYDIWVHGTSVVDISYSIIEGGDSRISTSSTGSLSMNNILDMDPLFNDPSSNDFSLSENSPAINSGNPNLGFDADGTLLDMGAIPFTCDVDDCGVCDGDNSTCTDWCGIPNGDNSCADITSCEIGEGEVIPYIPFSTSGNTTGLVKDFTNADEYFNSTGGDYVYELNLSEYSVLNISTCGAWEGGFDPVITFYQFDDDCNAVLIAGNDDYSGLGFDYAGGGGLTDEEFGCTASTYSYDSALFGLGLEAGDYMLVVSGYSSAEGQFPLTIEYADENRVASTLKTPSGR